jgi:hypothetical protein
MGAVSTRTICKQLLTVGCVWTGWVVVGKYGCVAGCWAMHTTAGAVDKTHATSQDCCECQSVVLPWGIVVDR